MTAADDPVALRSAALARWFSLTARRHVRRSFDAVRILKGATPDRWPGRPVVVAANHPSWWDPMIFVVVAARLFPDRVPFGPMDAEALRKYPFMRRIGVFPVEPGPRGAARFLRAGGRILDDPRALVFVTAQGRFTDPRQRPIATQPGAARLVQRTRQAVLLPMALEYPFWTERLPEALVAFGPALEAEQATREAADRALTQTMDRLADAATARDPSRFEVILAGRSGVGPVYDAWRAARARVAGRRFSRRHGEEEGAS